MNRLLTIVLVFLTIVSFAQKKQKIDLDWKIETHEKLSYMTVMSEVDTSSIELNFIGLSKSFSDSTGRGISEVKDFFKNFNNAFKNVDLMTTLTNKGGGIIDIVTVANQTKEKQLQSDTAGGKQKELTKMIQSMTQGVMLRGSVYETGGIHSFWVKTNQKM